MLEVGRVVKPHGLKGQVVVELWTNRPERTQPGARLVGAGRELTVRQASPAGTVTGWSRWLVAFDGVESRPAAEELRGVVLTAEPLEVAGAMWVHELVGAEVFDDSGRALGQVEAVEANPTSDLLVLADGRVLPLTFVSRDDDGRLTVSGPPGLLEA
ncbi:MAG: hypothetical protein JO337_05120 [Acidimicrobiales bacterium]|nr:hypothetical protein [Acidimicrobiales bacterium]